MIRDTHGTAQYRGEGGEALLNDGRHESETIHCPQDTAERWYALWTRSNAENLVCEQLRAKGLQPFLPRLDQWRTTTGGGRVKYQPPMFPGYLLLRTRMSKSVYVDVVKSRGLVCILGRRWDKLAVVADAEVNAIRKLVDSGLSAIPHPYLTTGTRVQVMEGPLAGVEGTLVQLKREQGLLVISVTLFQRSVAVDVDYRAVRKI